MKANEAPEKIYVSNYNSGLTYNWHNERLAVNDIEYTCTDAFIEKTCEYMRNHIDQQLTIYHEQTWKKRDEFIDDFRKYMRGE